MHSLAYHSESLLDNLLEISPDCHNFTDAFHAAAYGMRYTLEFIKVPSGDFADNIIESRFKACGCGFCHRILQFMKSVSETKLCSYECKRVACCF